MSKVCFLTGFIKFVILHLPFVLCKEHPQDTSSASGKYRIYMHSNVLQKVPWAYARGTFPVSEMQNAGCKKISAVVIFLQITKNKHNLLKNISSLC